MYFGERRERILEQLRRVGFAKVGDIARLCGVTEETVRKDLIRMDKQGDVKRTRGGAERVAQQRYDLPLPEREQLNRREKQAIALAACKLIQTRDSVFLDASSTVLEMTRFFPSKDLTVITNANHVVVALGDRLDVNLICTGGEYERRSRSYVGMVAEDAVQRYYLQWMFIGVDGLDAARGASEVNPGQARLKERILPMAENVCILADHTKLGRKSPFFFAKTNQFKYLITDAAASAAAVEPFREAGITIIRASMDELNY